MICRVPRSLTDVAHSSKIEWGSMIAAQAALLVRPTASGLATR